MNATNRNLPMSLDSKNNAVFTLLRYPELYIEEAWQNRPVVWFVAKREGYNGMMQNNDFAEDTLSAFSKMILNNERDTLSSKSSLSVYPNPFEDYLTIESPIDDEITIQNPAGRILLNQNISKGKSRIRMEKLTNGMYFICFVNQSKTFKIIKQ